jgi:hypothetical protein
MSNPDGCIYYHKYFLLSIVPFTFFVIMMLWRFVAGMTTTGGTRTAAAIRGSREDSGEETAEARVRLNPVKSGGKEEGTAGARDGGRAKRLKPAIFG